LFSDRLVGAAEKKKFQKFLSQTLSRDWRFQNTSEVIYYSSLQTMSVGAAPGDEASLALEEMGTGLTATDSKDFTALLETGLHSYEREFKNLNMILFPDILEHIAHVDRVLSRPGGSLLLVGPPGVGRQTAVTLVCHMLRIEMIKPHLSINYTSKHFRSELKEILRRAGVEGEKICFFFGGSSHLRGILLGRHQRIALCV
jgi:dynein heavy chain 2